MRGIIHKVNKVSKTHSPSAHVGSIEKGNWGVVLWDISFWNEVTNRGESSPRVLDACLSPDKLGSIYLRFLHSNNGNFPP